MSLTSICLLLSAATVCFAATVINQVDNSLNVLHTVSDSSPSLRVDINGTVLTGTSVLFEKTSAWYYVDMMSAQNYAVLAGAGVTNTGETNIIGDLGTHPTASITGAPTVTGDTHAADAAALQAKNDAATVTTYLSGLPCHQPVFSTEDIGGMTLAPGTYCWSSASASILTDLYLDGAADPHATFVFIIAADLTVATSVKVHLQNGAMACNVYWSVYGGVTLRTSAEFVGTIIAGSTIALQLGVTLQGRAISTSGQVTLLANTIDISSCATPRAATEVSIDTASASGSLPAGSEEVSMGSGSPIAVQITTSDSTAVTLTTRSMTTAELVKVTGSGSSTNLRVSAYDVAQKASTVLKVSLDSANRITATTTIDGAVQFRLFVDSSSTDPNGATAVAPQFVAVFALASVLALLF